MFERFHPSEVNNRRKPPSPLLHPAHAHEGAPADARLDDYLDHVCAPLVGLVPYARRQELRAELHSHLEALVATHEELGSARDAAVVLALRQFGPPGHLSRQWARAWVHGTSPTGVQPVWRALFIALVSFGLATLLALGLLVTVTRFPQFVQANISATLMTLAGAGLLLPLAAGVTTGLLAPARHALGTFCALAVLILPSAAVAIASPGQPPDSPSVLAHGLTLAVAQSMFWMPIGCAAAALGGSLRARLSQRPQRWALQ
jgi:AcrR family transcriptional regulator